MMMPFEWDVRVSSKDHTVTASTSKTRPATGALHHSTGHYCRGSWWATHLAVMSHKTSPIRPCPTTMFEEVAA